MAVDPAKPLRMGSWLRAKRVGYVLFPVYIVAFWEVGAEVAAAALLAAERGARDQCPNGDETRHAPQTLVPRVAGQCSRRDFLPRVQLRGGLGQPLARPDETDVLPHEIAHVARRRHSRWCASGGTDCVRSRFHPGEQVSWLRRPCHR